MATASTNAVIDHTSDAAFRTCAAELISLLTTGGALVQTTDTGQINTSTVTRPAVNTDAGYWCGRFSDSLQPTAPYFLRVDFGTGSSADHPRVRVTIGTGTNGSGTITGVLLPTTVLNRQAALASTVIAYPSWACGHAGTLGLAFKVGAGNAGAGWLVFGMHRTRAHTGAQTDEGLVVYYMTNDTAQMRQVVYRRVNPTSFGPSSACVLPPLGVTTSTQPGGNPQCYRHFTALPEVRPVLEWVSFASTEISVGAIEPARPVGAVDRNYICIGTCVQQAGGPGASATSHALGMMYD